MQVQVQPLSKGSEYSDEAVSPAKHGKSRKVRGSSLELSSRANMKRTLSSLRGETIPILNYKAMLKFMVFTILVPSAVIVVMFLPPTCGPYDSQDCHASYKHFMIIIPSAIFGFVGTQYVIKILEHGLMLELFRHGFTYRENAFITICILASGMTSLMIFTEIISVFPFTFPLFYLVMCNVGIPMCFIVLYYNYCDGDDNNEYILWKAFWICLVFVAGGSIIVLYVLFAAGYRYFESDSFFFYAYILVGLSVLREGSLYTMVAIWDRVNPSEFSMGQLWVFLMHSTTLSVLRGSTGGSSNGLLKLLALSIGDFVAIVQKVMYIKYGVGCFSGEAGEQQDNEVIHCTMYLILEELVEIVVPAIYLITASIIYYLPTGSLVAGIGSSDFGYAEIGNLFEFQQGLMIVLGLEIASFFLLGFLLKYFCNISLLYGFLEFIYQYNTTTMLGCTFAMSMMYMLMYTSYGADLSLEFSWL